MQLSATIVLNDQGSAALAAIRGHVTGLRTELAGLQGLLDTLHSAATRPILAPTAVAGARDGAKAVASEVKRAGEAADLAEDQLQLQAVPAAARAAAAAIKEVTVATRQAGEAAEQTGRKLRLGALRPQPAPTPVRHTLGTSLGLDDQLNARPLRPRSLLPALNVRGRVTLDDATRAGMQSALGNISNVRTQMQALQMMGSGLRGGGMAAMADGIGSMLPALGRLAPMAAAATGPLITLAAAAGLVAAGIAKASEMEDLEASLSTLLGSTEAARGRLEELAEFAAKTPFELPDVARASKVLQTLTGHALSTGAGLRMVGDVAANTGQPFADLAVWIGRTWDGLQNGRPVGEALMRLQELGIMSGATRSKIEELQAEGKKGEEVWQVAAASFAKFAGEMDRRSATLSGRMSNLKDSAGAALREIGGPFMQAAKDGVAALTRSVELATAGMRYLKAISAAGLGIPEGSKIAGTEGVMGLLDRARALKTLEERTQLLADLERELARVRADAAKSPGLDYSTAIFQLEKVQKMVGKMSTAHLRDSAADGVRADAKAETAKTAPQDRAALDASLRQMQDANDAALMEAAEDMAAKERFARRRAWRAGQAISPQAFQGEAGTLDQAKQRLEQMMTLLRQHASTDPLGLAQAAEQARRVAAAHAEVLSLQRQINAARKAAVEKAVADFFGEMDAGKEKKTAPVVGRSLLEGDRLAKIGLFVGGAGGPTIDYARRTAVGVEKLVGIIKTNAIPLSQGIGTTYV